SLTQAIQSRIAAEVRYQALKSTAPQNIPDVINSLQIQQARKQYYELQQQYEEKLKTYKPEYPEMQRMRAQLDHAKQNMDETAKQVYQDILNLAKADYDKAIVNQSALQSQIQQAQRQSMESGTKELTYDQIQMEIDTKKQLLTALLQKENQ